MFNVATVLAVLALIFTIVSAMGKLPLWPAVLCLTLLSLLAAGGIR